MFNSTNKDVQRCLKSEIDMWLGIRVVNIQYGRYRGGFLLLNVRL